MRRAIRILAWLGIGLLVLLLAGGVWFFFSVRAASQRADEMKAAIAASGDPVSFAELVPPEIPDADNAAVPLLEAFRILADAREADDARGESDSSLWVELRDRLEGAWSESPARSNGMRAWWTRRRAVEAPLRVALSRPHCRLDALWRTLVDDLEAGAASVSLGGADSPRSQEPNHGATFRGLTDLTDWLRIGALLAAEAGERDEAWRRVEEGLLLGGLVYHNRMLIPFLLRIEQVRRTLEVARVVAGRFPPDPSRRERVLRLLLELDEPEAHRRAWIGQRAEGLDLYAYLARPGSAEYLPSAWMRWLLAHDEVRFLEQVAKVIELAGRPISQNRDAWFEIECEIDQAPRWALMSGISLIPAKVTPGAVQRFQAAIRVARAGVAIEGHRREDGTLPVGLEATVKLVDPYTDRPLRCRQEQDGAYIVYWLGHHEGVIWNAVDQGELSASDLAEAGLADQVWRVPAGSSLRGK